jgi:anti-anti-sigma regulatory factor
MTDLIIEHAAQRFACPAEQAHHYVAALARTLPIADQGVLELNLSALSDSHGVDYLLLQALTVLSQACEQRDIKLVLSGVSASGQARMALAGLADQGLWETT